MSPSTGWSFQEFQHVSRLRVRLDFPWAIGLVFCSSVDLKIEYNLFAPRVRCGAFFLKALSTQTKQSVSPGTRPRRENPELVSHEVDHDAPTHRGLFCSRGETLPGGGSLSPRVSLLNLASWGPIERNETENCRSYKRSRSRSEIPTA